MSNNNETEMPHAHSLGEVIRHLDPIFRAENFDIANFGKPYADKLMNDVEQREIKGTDSRAAAIHYCLEETAFAKYDNFYLDPKILAALISLQEQKVISEHEARVLIAASIRSCKAASELQRTFAELRHDSKRVDLNTGIIEKATADLEFVEAKAPPPAFPGAAGS